ncbi:phage baseplate assembly protein V [Streptomyces sp. NPDC059080]|uniref:phage baseplate assembly protein V n=1 Tax=Streptomyces sp. NPDC059080 TaxID=3346718 RepID=UPI0036BB1EE1
MNPLYGTYSAIVVSAQDPQNRNRVRLRIPQITGTAVSGWAEPASVGAALPGDQVYVAFDGGDRNYPIYWPRPAVTGIWTPLPLERGWVASSAGMPAYRVTADGIVELSGSVETSTAIGLGTTVKFATLPVGARPLETYRAATATVYRGAYNSKIAYGDYRATHNVTSTSYTTDANGPSLSFVAPGSGQVVAVFGCFSQSTTTAGRCLMSVRVSQGSTTIADADDNYSAEVQSDANGTGANSRMIAGLTPGSTYSVTALYRNTDTGATAQFDNKWIVAYPVGLHDTPTARVTLSPAGDVQALFPAGAAPPYDMSLTGVRARII